MHFLDLHINGFGKFHDTSLTFQNKLNVIYGKNEAGKSTIHSFIRGMLFGIEPQREGAVHTDLYSKYKPWESDRTYEGQLRLEKDGIIYRIERNFERDKKEFKVINETIGREIAPTKAFLDQLLCGLNETSYHNTISISQLKSATDEGMISELKNYIANMNSSGNIALNVTKATSYLKNQKKYWEAKLTPDADKAYYSLSEEIQKIEKEISSPPYENQILEYKKKRQTVKQKIELILKEQENLRGKMGRGQKILHDFNFSDEASVSSCLEQAEKLYQHYHRAFYISEHKIGQVFAIISFILAFLCAGSGSYLVYDTTLAKRPPLFGSTEPLFIIYTLAAVCFASLASGIFITVLRSRKNKEALDCVSELSELLKPHLKSSAISDETMDSFRSRLTKFTRLCQMINLSERTIKEQENQISKLREEQNTFSELIEEQQNIQWELEKKLEQLSDCKNRAEALKQILIKNNRIQQEISAIELAEKTIKELSISIRDSFGLYLNKTASELIASITGGVYRSISVDENLNVFLNTEKKRIPLEQVSGGTADQIYLALRLAAAKLIQGGIEKMPLIFDDSFVLYDEERLKAALNWISFAYPGQILLFTCHKREERILQEQNIEHHFIQI